MSRVSKFRDVRHLVRHDALQLLPVERASSPSVTAMLACCGSRPVAKALGSGSGTTQIRGRGWPAAIAISSTTLTYCFCSGVAGSTISHAPVAQSTRSAPFSQAYQRMPPATSVATMPMNGMT